MPIVKIDKDAIDKDTIVLTDNGDVSNCTHPAGHCFGSDGGSGIPTNLKVPEGQGGEFRVQKLSADKTRIEEDAYYERCQYCGKMHFIETKQQRDEKTNV